MLALSVPSRIGDLVMNFRVLFSALALTCFMAESASALSCMRPDLGQTMEKAKSSDKLYYILQGSFRSQYTMPQPKPSPNGYQQPQPIRTTMWFDGRGIGQKPWQDSRLSYFPVDVQTSCAASWCGHLPQEGEQMIAFVEARHGQAPLLRIGACPEWLFRLEPQKGQIKKLRDCFDKPCRIGGDRVIYK